jgi:ribosomal protein S18 acetylase RimI-like enzyme
MAAGNRMDIKIETPGSDSYDELIARLVGFNRESAPWSPDAFTVAAYSENRDLVGGVRGIVNMGLVEVRGLWVDPPFRKTGLGARLMTMLENHAQTLGATRAALQTYDWQALGLYEKLGYRIFGTLAYPSGAKRYHMEKDLPA